MKTRGKVLREPNSGPGLLMIDGRQFRFSLPGVWHSETPPRPGLNVQVEIDHDLQVIGITAIPDSPEAGGQEEAGIEVAKGNEGRDQKLIRKLGVPAVIAAVFFLLVGWFFLAK